MPVISPYFDQITILINKVFSRRNFWIYLIAILLLITLPINTPGSKFYLNNITVVKIRGDYFFHALTFIPWAFFMVAMKQRPWTWLVLGLLFSTGTELLQYLLPYRRFNINDLISNSLGIFLGIGILIFLMNGLKQRQTTS
jgi:glycopeptide antibiotics resistance protein